MRRFPLAPMDTLMWVFTGVALSLIPLFAVLSLLSGPVAPVLLGTLGALFLVYTGVWLGWRPAAFGVEGRELLVIFPAWTRRIPLDDFESARAYPGRTYRDEVGFGLRVGVGGLWGVFGWLIASNGWVEVYTSRIDDLALVRFRGRMPLLVSPADLDGFVAAVAEAAAA